MDAYILTLAATLATLAAYVAIVTGSAFESYSRALSMLSH